MELNKLIERFPSTHKLLLFSSVSARAIQDLVPLKLTHLSLNLCANEDLAKPSLASILPGLDELSLRCQSPSFRQWYFQSLACLSNLRCLSISVRQDEMHQVTPSLVKLSNLAHLNLSISHTNNIHPSDEFHNALQTLCDWKTPNNFILRLNVYYHMDRKAWRLLSRLPIVVLYAPLLPRSILVELCKPERSRLECLKICASLTKSSLDCLVRAPCLQILHLSTRVTPAFITYEELETAFERSQLQRISLTEYQFADQTVTCKTLRKKPSHEPILRFLNSYLPPDVVQIVMEYSRWCEWNPWVGQSFIDQV
jgi:hypothetical protein